MRCKGIQTYIKKKIHGHYLRVRTTRREPLHNDIDIDNPNTINTAHFVILNRTTVIFIIHFTRIQYVCILLIRLL